MDNIGEISADQLAKEMALESFQIMREDQIWRMFGFNKAPKRGNFFNKFISEENLRQEGFIKKNFSY